MSLLRVVRMGHPILRLSAKPLSKEEIASPQTKELVTNMFFTMKRIGMTSINLLKFSLREADSLDLSRALCGMGLAAPQVGVSQQIVVLDIPEIGSNPPVNDKVLFNPMMEYLLKHEKIKMWESCLSVPGLTGKVERYNNVLIHYYDENGIKRRIGASGYLAGVFQHEIDHLNGRLYVDGLVSPQALHFDEEWHHYHSQEDDVVDDGHIKFFEK